MTREDAKELFNPWLLQLPIDLKNIADIAFEQLPDYFFVKPASSTGKYHPKFANEDGGLVLHTLYALEVWKYLYNGFKDKLIYEAYACGIVAVMFHDALKYGKPEENRQYTTKTHPEDAANWLREIIITWINARMWKTETKISFLSLCEDYIIKPIEHHQGPWSNYGSPEGLMQELIFIADYVASQPTFEKELFKCENN